MQGSSGRHWLVPIGTAADLRMRLFCFPPAGSGTVAYRSWAKQISPGVQLVAVLPPGRETRFAEASIDDMADMVSAAADAIGPATATPFALFGHSLGALVAYEVARRLTAQGRGPERLFVSGHQAPSVGSRRAPIAHLPDDAFLRGLVDLGGTPREVLDSPELLALVLPMLRADFALAERYRPLPGLPLACPVTALGGVDDPWVDAEGLDAWRGVTTGAFDSAMLPGDHFYLAPSRDLILRRINERLAPCLTVA